MFIPGQAEGGVTEHAKAIATGICYYSYDKFNRMIKASPVGASGVEYKYNGEGLRVEKIAEGKTTRYVYEYDKVVLEVNEKGQQTARNVHGLNPISRTASGSTMYYLFNGHADVTALIDGAGTIQRTYYYDAFGNITQTTGTLDNPFAYAGYQYDKETGLYYLNSRMYDPKTARFMQEDTYRGDVNDPLSLNLYTYCHNEPIMYSDPTGHARANEQDLRRESGKNGSDKVKVSNNTKNQSSKTTSNNKTKKVDSTRVVQGTAKTAKGGLVLAMGVIAISAAATVLTGGLATPLLVTAIASTTVITGTALTVMGTSDMLEGGQDIIYGVTGSEKKSTNYVRDGVFNGDQDKYDKFQMNTVVVTSLGLTALTIAPSISKGKNSEANTPAATQNQSKKIIENVDEKAGNADELVKVYRGTSSTAEQMIHDETGHLMSDATRRAYMETGNIEQAYKASEPINNEWLRIWGNENNYVQAHGEFGNELSQAFGLDRTMMSVTTDPAIAQKFAGQYGKVYEALIPRSQLIRQILNGAGESEYLIKFGSGGFK